MELSAVLRAYLPMRQLHRSIDRWGPTAGLRLWWGLRGARKGLIREIWVPGYRHPVALRPSSSDVAVFEQIFLRGGLDGAQHPQHCQLVEQARALGRRAVIVDGGANIGLSSIWLANAFPDATIFAVEPDAGNAALLRRNVSFYSNIIPIEAALWDRPTSLSIVNAEADSWAFRVGERDGAPKSRPVPAIGINELLARSDGGELLMAKLVIQGAEKAVFRSNLDWLSQTRLVIFMPNDWADPWGGAGRTAMRALSRLPFDWVVKDQCLFCYRDPAESASSGYRDQAISR